MSTLFQHVHDNLMGYGLGGGLLLIAAIHTMPIKAPFKWINQELWDWIRMALQTAAPIRTTNPTPPVDPANQKEQAS